jgi:hypothetical protein
MRLLRRAEHDEWCATCRTEQSLGTLRSTGRCTAGRANNPVCIGVLGPQSPRLTGCHHPSDVASHAVKDGSGARFWPALLEWPVDDVTALLRWHGFGLELTASEQCIPKCVVGLMDDHARQASHK